MCVAETRFTEQKALDIGQSCKFICEKRPEDDFVNTICWGVWQSGGYSMAGKPIKV